MGGAAWVHAPKVEKEVITNALFIESHDHSEQEPHRTAAKPALKEHKFNTDLEFKIIEVGQLSKTALITILTELSTIRFKSPLSLAWSFRLTTSMLSQIPKAWH